MLLLCVLLVIKGSTTTAVLFPLGLLGLLYVRVYVLPLFFTKTELRLLDPIVYHDHNE